MTTGGVKGDEYNMEEVLAALGETKKKSKEKAKKRPAQSSATTNAREKEIPKTVVELTSPSSSVSVEGETPEVESMDMASRGLMTETSQQILFDENLFDENLSDEHSESPQPVIKEMYEPAAPAVENRQTTSYGLNCDAKEFIPRHSSVTPPSWVFLLPADSTLPHDLRLPSPIPDNPQTQLLPPPYGHGSNNFAPMSFSPCLADPDKPDHLVSQNLPSSGVSSPLQCCSFEANVRHPGSRGQYAQSLKMSLSPGVLGRQLVHHQPGFRTNFPGIVPVSPFFTPVQPGHPHQV